jgi:hypothetical protein
MFLRADPIIFIIALATGIISFILSKLFDWSFLILFVIISLILVETALVYLFRKYNKRKQ